MNTTCSIGVSPGTIVTPPGLGEAPLPVPPLAPGAGEVAPEGPVAARSFPSRVAAHPSAAMTTTTAPRKAANPRRRAARRRESRNRFFGIGTLDPGPEGVLMVG
jgi:hypothetical protein